MKKMAKEKQNKEEIARNKIREALTEYYAPFHSPSFPKDYVKNNELKKLQDEQINNAVVAFSLTLYLFGGSSCDVDLYCLLQGYLKDIKIRRQINAIILGRES